MFNKSKVIKLPSADCTAMHDERGDAVISTDPDHFCFAFPDEIMQQEIRPLLAVDIIEQLHRQFAMLSGERWTCVG